MKDMKNSDREGRIYVCSHDRIEKNENNLVNLVLSSGERIEALEPRRLFPVNFPEKYITLLNGDGDEVAVIRSLTELDEKSEECIRRSLNDYYLVPEIIKILAVSEKSGTIRWTVLTDRGEKSFDIRNRNHDIRIYKNGAVRVRDSDDNRYIIQNYNALDQKSRMKMMPYL